MVTCSVELADEPGTTADALLGAGSAVPVAAALALGRDSLREAARERAGPANARAIRRVERRPPAWRRHGNGKERADVRRRHAGPGDLGRRIAARRRQLGTSRAELAAKAGLSVAYLTYLETRPALVTMTCLIELADALGTTADALLGAGSPVPVAAATGTRPR